MNSNKWTNFVCMGKYGILKAQTCSVHVKDDAKQTIVYYTVAYHLVFHHCNVYMTYDEKVWRISDVLLYRYNLFTGCPEAKTCTLILRGGAEQFIEETERSLHDAIMIVRRAMKNDAVVAGICYKNTLW